MTNLSIVLAQHMPNLAQSANRYFCKKCIVRTGQDTRPKPGGAARSVIRIAQQVRFTAGLLAGEFDRDLVA
jgi:hypothetical protein